MYEDRVNGEQVPAGFDGWAFFRKGPSESLVFFCTSQREVHKATWVFDDSATIIYSVLNIDGSLGDMQYILWSTDPNKYESLEVQFSYEVSYEVS